MIIGEICADCGKEIGMLDPSYYRKGPDGEIGQSYHSTCGDPFGLKLKDAEIKRLQEMVEILEAEIRVMRKLPGAIDAALSHPNQTGRS